MKSTDGHLRKLSLTRITAAQVGLIAVLFSASCITHEQKQSSPDELLKFVKQLDKITPINRANYRNPQLFEILAAQQRAASAIANSQTPEQRDIALKVYERFSRQLRLREAVLQQLAFPGPPKQGRIVNGRDVQLGQIPYQAALISTGYPDPYYGQYCGATIIDPSWVVTAGHCVGGAQTGGGNANCRDSALIQTGDIQVYIGSPILSTSNGGTLVNVAEICVNPNYAVAGLHQESDIALIKLASSVHVQTLAKVPDLNTQTTLFAFTHNATISGWGQTDKDNTTPRTLQFGTVLVMPSNVVCQTSYPSDTIANSMVCAASNVSDTCYGDSGGPLVMRTADTTAYVEGVTSWAAGQCGQGVPSVYVRVPFFSQWIHDVTGIAVGTS